MSYTLRDYQATTVDRCVEFLQSDSCENGIGVLPTGAGKSLVIANVVQRLGEPCLVFQPSKELLEQNFEKFRSYGYRPAIYSASAGEKRVGEITLATIGSVRRKAHVFDHVRYAIIDECHAGLNAKGGVFKDFLEQLDGVRVLGFTATPYRQSTDGYGGTILKFLTRTRPRIFHKLVHVVQNAELFDAGYLCPVVYKQVRTGFDTSALRLNSTGADYTDESVQRHLHDLHFSDQIVRVLNKLRDLNRGSALVFTRFVEEAQYVAKRVGGACVHAKTPPKERGRIVRGFKAGAIPYLINVGVYRCGFDYPALANVVLAQPTLSLGNFYQEVGRVVRTSPGKACGWVIDMVGLVEMFGRVQDLEIVDGGNEKWHVESQGRQLTNVYYSERN